MSDTTTLPVDVAQPDDEQFAITDLAPAARALVALNSTDTEFALLILAGKHSGLVKIKDKVDREQVHGAAMELMRARTSINERADDAREGAKKFNAAVIAEQKRLVALVEPEEKRLKSLRDAYDTEQERIKREAEEKERARMLALGARIQEIRGFARLAQDCRSSDAVRRLVDRLATIDMTGFAEFEAEAINVLTETRQQVEQVLNARMSTEAEAARLKAEREELARQQAEAKQKAEELAVQQKAEADKLAEERAAFALQQKEAADKLAEQQAEVARLRAEIEAAKATIPAEVAPEKQAMADAVHEIADVGIAIADELLIKSPIANGAPVFTESEDFGVVAIDSACTQLPPADADLVDVVEIESAATGVIGFDMGTDTPPAASLINCIAHEYGVAQETACRWLCARALDFEFRAMATD